MNSITEISNRINKHDNWACMSDSNEVYNKGQRDNREIKAILSELSVSELIELKTLISNKDSLRTFSEYFENLPTEPMENEQSFMEIMEAASFYFVNGIYADWKECIIVACKADKLKESLKAGIVSFSYTKADKSKRSAVGTLRSSYYTYEHKGATKKYRPDLIKYFDLDRNAFRCGKIQNLITINQEIKTGVAA